MSNLNNKLILLTGAAGGLGREMISAFLKEGSQLILSDLQESSLNSIIKEFQMSGTGKIVGSIASDLSTESGIDSLFHKFLDYGFSAPDILVNNAGIAILGSFAEIPSSKWEAIININLLAPMRLTHKFLPSMINRGSGHIVNVSSVAGLIAVPYLNIYSVSKFGIKAFGESLHGELSSKGIQVTNFYPFFTRTPILQSEQIGMKGEMKVPDFLLSEPKDVVSELIQGIKKNQLHVHPGGISKVLDFVSRFLPGAINPMTNSLISRV
jgi:short-subunit dehydrogenase